MIDYPDFSNGDSEIGSEYTPEPILIVGPEPDWSVNELPINEDITGIINTDVNVVQILNDVNDLSWENTNQTSVFENLSNQFDLEMYGDPIAEIENFDLQDDPYSCAIATTNMIFNSFGYDFGEDVFSEAFETLDIYDPESGTSTYFMDEAINTFSEVNGLDLNATEINGFNIEDLQTHLDAGDRLLIALDSYELYVEDGMTLNEVLSIPDSGHAVQLTGIINSENGSFAIINDPGFPDGAGIQIPMDRFMNACSDFDFTAISVNKHIG